MEVLIEYRIGRCGRLIAGPRCRTSEPELGAGAELGDRPRQPVIIDGGLNCLGVASRQLDHLSEADFDEDLGQGRPHRGSREGIARQSTTDAAHVVDIGSTGSDQLRDLRRHVSRDSIGTTGNSATDGLADDEDVGLQALGTGHTGRTG
jgi:hypothetical protein